VPKRGEEGTEIRNRMYLGVPSGEGIPWEGLEKGSPRVSRYRADILRIVPWQKKGSGCVWEERKEGGKTCPCSRKRQLKKKRGEGKNFLPGGCFGTGGKLQTKIGEVLGEDLRPVPLVAEEKTTKNPKKARECGGGTLHSAPPLSSSRPGPLPASSHSVPSLRGGRPVRYEHRAPEGLENRCLEPNPRTEGARGPSAWSELPSQPKTVRGTAATYWGYSSRRNFKAIHNVLLREREEGKF